MVSKMADKGHFLGKEIAYLVHIEISETDLVH